MNIIQFIIAQKLNESLIQLYCTINQNITKSNHTKWCALVPILSYLPKRNILGSFFHFFWLINDNYSRLLA